MSGYLLDTNVPSEMTRPLPDPKVEAWLDQTDNDLLFLSVISLSEIIRGIARLPESRRRLGLERWLEETLRPWFAGRILPINAPIAERLGRLTGERELIGKPISFSDGLIAATAMEYGLTVVTRNVKHFASLNVTIFNPWD